jgi:hypothetical protein
MYKNVCMYVGTRQHTSAYVNIRQHTLAHVSTRQHTSVYVSIRQHTSAYEAVHLVILLPRSSHVTRYEEIKLEDVGASHTLGGAGEDEGR